MYRRMHRVYHQKSSTNTNVYTYTDTQNALLKYTTPYTIDYTVPYILHI